MKKSGLIIAFFIGACSIHAQDVESTSSDLAEKKKNSVYVAQDFLLTLSLNYERLFPLNEKTCLGIRGALGRDGGNKDNTAIAGAIFLYGKSKHFLEFSVAYQHPNLFETGSDDNPKLAILGGYRFQAPGGFLFKVYPEFLPDLWPDEESWGSLPFLGFALGYSF